ncbi:MAG: hypothetical protein JEZ07_10155 [Phycisphaerae bacterium]|nr:hypothetical protein [Phycisphaerae bacterium]
MTFVNICKNGTYVVLALAGAFLAGCETTKTEIQLAAQNPLGWSANSDNQRTNEAARVEKMAQYRENYQQQLGQLIDFYSQQGNHLKAQWASQELAALKMVPKREYLMIAEIAGPDLRPSDAIAEADSIYNEAVVLFNSAKGSLFSGDDKAKMQRACDLFDQIIIDYPRSDKIEDAAYMIGEIYNRKADYYTALIYYQRVWQWNPATEYPVRYTVARIYDDKLNDSINAMKFYELAIELEKSHTNNVGYAQRRLKMMTTGQ